MKRLLVNDQLTAIPGTKTFWDDLNEWFDCHFVGGSYDRLVHIADEVAKGFDLIIRNASWFPPMEKSAVIPTISLLQDIFDEGPQRKMQESVMFGSKVVVFNSEYTKSRYKTTDSASETVGLGDSSGAQTRVIPLPVDFSLFEPGNALGLQQSESLPDGAICWIGASEGAAGEIKGFKTFISLVRQNPDLTFVGVFKDKAPAYGPPNLRLYERLDHERLVKVMGACRVGLCTSLRETQHLAGIEMGACGLPLVVPPVGTYWNRSDMPGVVVGDSEVATYTAAIRGVLANTGDPQKTRDYWKCQFDVPVIRSQWESLVREVEHDGESRVVHPEGNQAEAVRDDATHSSDGEDRAAEGQDQGDGGV